MELFFYIKTVRTINWIVLNRTEFLYKNGFYNKSPTMVNMP